MKGLLLKDIINLKGQLVTYLVIYVIWMAVGYFNDSPAFFMGVMQMLIVMIPLMALAYDEKARWDQFAVTMPITRRQIVLSRYLFVMMVIVVFVLLAGAGSMIIGGVPEETLIIMVFSIPLGMIINDISLPVMLKFGVEKGRFVFLGVIALCFLIGFAVAKIPETAALMEMEILDFAADRVAVAMVIFWAAGVAITAISMLFSFRVYKKKEF